jgi:hypothetical protein
MLDGLVFVPLMVVAWPVVATSAMTALAAKDNVRCFRRLNRLHCIFFPVDSVEGWSKGQQAHRTVSIYSNPGFSGSFSKV